MGAAAAGPAAPDDWPAAGAEAFGGVAAPPGPGNAPPPGGVPWPGGWPTAETVGCSDRDPVPDVIPATTSAAAATPLTAPIAPR
jgi:hypothetical protein